MNSELARNHTEAITEAVDVLNGMGRQALAQCAYLGSLLKEAKADCGHGNWELWVTENLPIKPSQAWRYMRVHTAWSEGNLAHVQDLSLREAVKLISKLGDEKKPDPTQGLTWTKYAGPIGNFLSWVEKRKADAPVEQWPPVYQRAIRDRCRPVVELYAQLSQALEEDGE